MPYLPFTVVYAPVEAEVTLFQGDTEEAATCITQDNAFLDSVFHIKSTGRIYCLPITCTLRACIRGQGHYFIKFPAYIRHGRSDSKEVLKKRLRGSYVNIRAEVSSIIPSLDTLPLPLCTLGRTE